MKVMQINVWQGRLLRPLINLIQQTQPDIIFAQEIYSYEKPTSIDSTWNFYGTLEYILSKGHYKYHYFSPSTTFNFFGHQVSFGNAIISRYPLESCSTHFTAGPGPVHLDSPATFDWNQTRNFQHVVTTLRDKKLNLINHHGHWVDQPLGNELSYSHLLELAAYINQLEGSVIMCGDLNLSPQSPSIRAFLESTKLTDLVATTPAKTTLSEAHYVSDVLCDFVLISPDLQAEKVAVLDQLVSDHKAVLAQIN